VGTALPSLTGLPPQLGQSPRSAGCSPRGATPGARSSHPGSREPIVCTDVELQAVNRVNRWAESDAELVDFRAAGVRRLQVLTAESRIDESRAGGL
jgi:hypothetical protein